MDKRKILIIDDDRDQQLGLGVRLRASGYDVAFASDGAQAIQAVRREGPDLVILDIGLPAGDGFQVIGRLKSLAPTAPIPIIVLSARDPAGNRDRMLAAGAEAYFQKPADVRLLLGAIQALLGEEAGLRAS